MAQRHLRSTHSTDSAASPSATRGFTIVELLVVIVVIAILAAISIVAYNGIQNRARVSAASSALNQAAKKLSLYAADNSGSYPAAAADFFSEIGANSSGVKADVTYQYSVNNSADPKTYCVTATVGNVSYKITQTGTPSPGGCAGHGQGGSAAITNLATDPSATSLGVSGGGAGWTTVNWFGPGGAGSYNLVTGAGDGPSSNQTSYVRKTWTQAPSSTGATGIRNSATGANGLAVNAGGTYTFSVWLRASKTQASAATMLVEWTSSSGTGVGSSSAPLATLPANSWTRLSLTASAPSGATHAGVISHINGGTPWAAGDRLDGTGLMITSGTTLYTFADGNSSDWVWNGAVNNSTSTGPAL